MFTFLVFPSHRLPVPRLVDVVAEEVRGDVGPLAPAPSAEGGGDGHRRNSQGEQEEPDHRFFLSFSSIRGFQLGSGSLLGLLFYALVVSPRSRQACVLRRRRVDGTRYGEEEVKGFFCASTL